MKLFSTALTVTGLLSTAVNGAPAAAVESQLPAGPPPLPSEDPFYNQPEGLENFPLGHIFNWRDTQNSPGVAIWGEKVKSSKQFQYRTSNSSGAPMVTVGTMLIPVNADPNKLLVYSVAEDADNINCAPSYALQAYSNTVEVGNEAVELAAIDLALNKGWPVVLPDYEGPNSAYTAGILAGHLVLDSIRAVLNNTEFSGVNSDATVALWGYSGGSLASGWAAELQPTYYEELNIAGVAMGGLVPNLSNIVRYDDKPIIYGLVSLGIMGLANEYPDLQAVINAELIPEKKAAFESLKQNCLSINWLKNVITPWTSYFKDGIDVLNNPVVQRVMEENTQGKYVPKTSFMIYHAVFDELAPNADVQRWYDNYCSKGVNIEWNSDLVGEHIIEAVEGVPIAMSWLTDRFDGKAVRQGCTKNVHFSNLLDWRAFEELPGDILNLLKKTLASVTWFPHH